MKKFKLLTLAFITLLTAFTTSCSSDDDSGSSDDDNGMPVMTNEFVFDGTSYSLTQGIIQSSGATPEGAFNFIITLYSDGFNVDSVNGTVSGTGDLMFLDINTDTMNNVSDGTYNFSMTRDVFTTTNSGFIVNLDPVAGTSDAVELATSGSITLSISGTTYDIEFNFLNASGESITGAYTGTLVAI